MPKALVLLSGGLDSMLACKVLMEQGVEVTALSFKSCFFNTQKAKKAAVELGIKLIEVDFSEEHLKMVKNPKHGYGKNMNPCIDCHGMMLKYASRYLKSPLTPLDKGGKEKEATFIKGPACPVGRGLGEFFDFIATGEVLGQRPMSQNKEALKKVEKVAGLENKVLRPLSAKNLEETEMEKEKIIDREKLLDIQGRTREKQMQLADEFGIKEYPSPGGGCLLTDPEFAVRLKEMFSHWPECNTDDIELIKNGRVFWMASQERGEKALTVVGRNKEECENLEKLAKKGDIMVELEEISGPVTVVRIINYQLSIINESKLNLEIPSALDFEKLKIKEDERRDKVLEIAGLLTGYYSTKARGKKVKIKLIKN